MPHIDLLVLAAFALGTAACGVRLWRAGGRGRRFAAAFACAFLGVFLLASMAGHNVDVAYAALVLGRHLDGTPVAGFDFRTYGLLLLGVVLMGLGGRAVRAAVGLARGEAAARGEALRTVALVLAVVVPLIPVHAFFGYLVSGLATATGLVVGLASRERRAAAVAA